MCPCFLERDEAERGGDGGKCLNLDLFLLVSVSWSMTKL